MELHISNTPELVPTLTIKLSFSVSAAVTVVTSTPPVFMQLVFRFMLLIVGATLHQSYIRALAVVPADGTSLLPLVTTDVLVPGAVTDHEQLPSVMPPMLLSVMVSL